MSGARRAVQIPKVFRLGNPKAGAGQSCSPARYAGSGAAHSAGRIKKNRPILSQMNL